MMSNRNESVRDAFGSKLAELCLNNAKVLALDGDLGNSTRLSVVESKVPDSFLQMGIAEQNMVGVAAGLASVGFQPWVCSFATFLTKRAYDQIVVSIDQPIFDVKLVGAYSGLLTSNTGKTHHALDDIGLMTMLPNMTVIAPGDANETRAAMEAIHHFKGPVYLRLTRDDEIVTFMNDLTFTIGEGRVLQEGYDVAILSTGSMTHRVVQAAKLLHDNSVSIHHLHLPTLKPLDRNRIVKAARQTKLVVTVEEHYIHGGLGSLVTEILAEEYPTRVIRIGVNNEYSQCGKNEELLDYHGLTADKIADRVLQSYTQ